MGKSKVKSPSAAKSMSKGVVDGRVGKSGNSSSSASTSAAAEPPKDTPPQAGARRGRKPKTDPTEKTPSGATTKGSKVSAVKATRSKGSVLATISKWAPAKTVTKAKATVSAAKGKGKNTSGSTQPVDAEASTSSHSKKPAPAAAVTTKMGATASAGAAASDAGASAPKKPTPAATKGKAKSASAAGPSVPAAKKPRLAQKPKAAPAPKKAPKPKTTTMRVLVLESDFDQIYQFKITLMGSSPEIWRRIQVPHVSNFRQLHWAIQASMGWRESHCHEFRMYDETRIGTAIDGLGMDILDETKELIADRFSLTHEFNNRIKYEYDFGDGWEHMVQLEKIFKGEPKQFYPVCVEGKNACPPEDVGGLGGYYNFLKILKNRKHPEYSDTRNWADDYGWVNDPKHFNPAECNFFR